VAQIFLPTLPWTDPNANKAVNPLGDAKLLNELLGDTPAPLAAIDFYQKVCVCVCALCRVNALMLIVYRSLAHDDNVLNFLGQLSLGFDLFAL
jgi:hypothetical protein